MKSTKKALLTSVLALVLCLSMLIGTTFAWFTDTDTIAVSNIVSGTLDIEIVDEQGNEKTTPLAFVNAEDSANILWEPGATFRTEGFQIKNVGSLYLKFKVEINNTEVSYNKLNEAITFYLVDGDGNKVDLSTMKDLPLAPNATYGNGTTLYIEGHMDENAGNEYQDLTLSGVGITIYAAQYTYETDMDDNQYDKDAIYDGDIAAVASADDFIKAFNELENGGTISLTADIDMTGKAWTPVNNKSFTLNGNGKTITGLNGGLVDHVGSGEITIKNVTFDGLVDNSTSNYAGLIGDADTTSYILMENVTITNANVSSAEWAGGFVAYTSGYGNDNDGPVNAAHNFVNCKITNSTIHSTGDGSVGGLVGHCGGNDATTTNIKGFTQSGLTLTQATSRPDKSGNILGTAGNGIVYIDNAEIATDIGRFVPAGTGKLVINGVEQTAFANN